VSTPKINQIDWKTGEKQVKNQLSVQVSNSSFKMCGQLTNSVKLFFFNTDTPKFFFKTCLALLL